ncbi:MAG: hypothetical protein MI919_26025, partial [Holophagales bacterium]|nr:hypothetical protein [Holophagales bacterium]
DGHAPETVVASSADPASLEALAASARVVATTVGPYARYGEPLVKACVDRGADYLDITGEPEFVGRVIETYDAPARDANVLLVSCCGFDSVPHDLGAYLTVQQLPSDQGIRVEGFVRGAGTVSGGTWHSAINAFSRPQATKQALRQLRPRPEDGRKVRAERPRVRRERRLGAWVAPLPTIDPWIVLRSAADLPEYGPSFRYGHYVRVKSLPRLVAGIGAVGAIAAGAQLGPTRRWLYSRRKPGEGPDAATRARSRFSVIFFGQADDGARSTVEVSGGDPGYGETSKMLAESALCLVHDRDRLAGRVGFRTPASAFGDVLLERLRAAGMAFEVVEP